MDIPVACITGRVPERRRRRRPAKIMSSDSESVEDVRQSRSDRLRNAMTPILNDSSGSHSKVSKSHDTPGPLVAGSRGVLFGSNIEVADTFGLLIARMLSSEAASAIGLSPSDAESITPWMSGEVKSGDNSEYGASTTIHQRRGFGTESGTRSRATVVHLDFSDTGYIHARPKGAEISSSVG